MKPDSRSSRITKTSRFQTFDDPSDREHVAKRVQALRDLMRQESLDGFLVPRADAYQGEYVAPGEERLAWLTGFNGSAGFAIVMADEAALFVDGRYTIQVQEQTDLAVFTPVDLIAMPPSRWLGEHVKAGARIGYDAWLLTAGQVEQFEKALAGKDAKLVAVKRNLIDEAWSDRPAEPQAAVALYPARFAGAEASDKIARIVAALGRDDALLLSDPHAVAWTFNIRGADVAHTPLPLSRALVRKDGRPTLYVAAQKLSNSVRDTLEKFADVRAPDDLTKDLAALGESNARLRFDAATAPAALVAAFRDAGGVATLSSDPVALMKAAKSSAERRGSRAAHLRDGVAMTRFLAWFDSEAPSGKLTEIDAAIALEGFRRRHGTPEGDFVSDDLRLWRACREPALPRHGGQQRADHKGYLSRRFRRAIRGRHDGHHTHRLRRPPERGDARPFYARLEGAYRHRARSLPERHIRCADRRARADGTVGGRARFRSRNGPRRRRLPLRA